MKKFLFVLLLAGYATSVPAAIFKCQIEEGGEVISNKRIGKSCKVVVTDADNTLPTPPKGQTRASSNPSPASFPKVTEDTQKSRDKDRKHILEQELSGELGKLEQAKKELVEQQAVVSSDKNPQKTLDRIQPYKDRVGQHERNIAAINKELSGLK